MPFSKDLLEPIKGMPPISEEEAEELAVRAQRAVEERYKEQLEPRPGEDSAQLQALVGVLEFADFRTSVMARQMFNAAEAFFHERDIILPAEEAFAAEHGLTAEDLDDAWNQRRSGIRGQLFRQETERRAALRDQFFDLVDGIGAERMGERYEYGQFIAEMNPEDLLSAVQARLDLPRSGE